MIDRIFGRNYRPGRLIDPASGFDGPGVLKAGATPASGGKAIESAHA